MCICDNHHFQVRGESKEELKKTLDLFFTIQEHKAIGYCESPKYGLILYWAEKDGITKFLTPPSVDTLTNIVWEWLQNLDWSNIKKQYDAIPMNTKYDEASDVWNNKGWAVFSESWGHANNQWQALCAISPSWLWLGK